jgi:hypothetical protein
MKSVEFQRVQTPLARCILSPEVAMRNVVFPEDPALKSIFGYGLSCDAAKATRAYRQRLLRAEARGLLPRRLYVSPRRFAWDAEELRAALAALPRSYAEALTRGRAA